MQCLEEPAAIGESFNIGNSRATITILGLANTVCRVLKSDSKMIHEPPLSADIAIRIPSVEKAERLLALQRDVAMYHRSPPYLRREPIMETIETAPVMALRPQDIDHLVNELQDYHAIYSPLFQRRERREWSTDSLHGCSGYPATSVEPIISVLKGPDTNVVRAMQQFIGAGAWQDAVLLRRHWHEVDVTLGDEDGVLPLDGRDVLQQGKESVGVNRQYCGDVGKRANGQAGVFLGSTSHLGSTRVDRRLSLPQDWGEDPAFAERRRTCGVPPRRFQTKPELGWEMIRAVIDEQALRCRWLTCDEACGRDTALLDQGAGSGRWYCAEVPHDTRVWQRHPGPHCQRGRGAAASPAVCTVAPANPTLKW